MNRKSAERPRESGARAPGAAVSALVLACALAVAGCNNSPSAPSVDTFTFRGQLATDARNVHLFVLPEFELVKIQLLEVRALLFDVTGGVRNPRIGVGLGHPDGEGGCETTFSSSYFEGGFTVHGLSADAYCLAVFDPNSFPEDALVEYTVVVEPE